MSNTPVNTFERDGFIYSQYNFLQLPDMDGIQKTKNRYVRFRITFTIAIVIIIYVLICFRLIHMGSQDFGIVESYKSADLAITFRPDIKDRNGELLATDIKTYSLYAEPREIVDSDEVIEQLSTVLKDINFENMHKVLTNGSGFAWLRRELTPRQRNKIIALGLPGIGFRSESLRFYPNGNTASHIIGHVNIDNIGIAGMEKHTDGQGLADLYASGLTLKRNLNPVNLSIDIRVQHFVRDELMKAVNLYSAIAAGAVVLDVDTGEILAMVSVPDYDSNQPAGSLRKDRINRMSAGLFEMGSVFKIFTVAMALDSGLVGLSDSFDATKPLRIAGHIINDFRAKQRFLTVPEIFIYSSNIGAARMALQIGSNKHREFLESLGLLSRLGFELPEVATPRYPKKWKDIYSATISYGHGILTTPLQTAVAAAALVNGGKLIAPTLLKRSLAQANKLARQAVKPHTSDIIRNLMRLNVLKGSGKKGSVKGYLVGGKTGTAEKVIDGKYSEDARFNSFLAAVPIDKPRYVFLTIIDEPKPAPGENSATAGLNAAPVTAAIINRSAAILGIKPVFNNNDETLLVSY